MPATKRKDMRADESLLFDMKSFQYVRSLPRATFSLLICLGLALLLACSFGCAPSSSQGDGSSSASASNDLPELTEEIIREQINYTRVRQIPDETGTAEPINWTFVENEPKEILVVDKRIEGNHATIILDIKTGSGPNARNPRSLSGQIRTEWILKTGWALRQWEIVDTENISMKVKNLPKPPTQNSNR
jgi:hypothetical protein